ncbi:hypothetical protein Areg01_81680 [Actinoplanes regularis]|nr:hypothetical protein Areg01_81680 [Actinoplanes regularis]
MAVLRAAALTPHDLPDQWPDPGDSESCRRWLGQVWARPDLAAGIKQASPGLAEQVQTLLDNAMAGEDRLRGAVMSTARYVPAGSSVSRPAQGTDRGAAGRPGLLCRQEFVRDVAVATRGRP